MIVHHDALKNVINHRNVNQIWIAHKPKKRYQIVVSLQHDDDGRLKERSPTNIINSASGYQPQWEYYWYYKRSIIIQSQQSLLQFDKQHSELHQNMGFMLGLGNILHFIYSNSMGFKYADCWGGAVIINSYTDSVCTHICIMSTWISLELDIPKI